MKFDGINCKRANHLGWRYANPETDKDLYNDPIDSYCVVIVKKSQCRTYMDDDGIWRYDPKDVPIIPMVSTGSDRGWGKVKERVSLHYPKPFRQQNGSVVYLQKYYTSAFYVVKDAIVYQGTGRAAYPSVGYYLERGLIYEEACILADEAKAKFQLL